jgi:hypothetical protein
MEPFVGAVTGARYLVLYRGLAVSATTEISRRDARTTRACTVLPSGVHPMAITFESMAQN